MATSAGSALSLVKTVLEIVADRATGLLDVRSEGLHTGIYFAEGKPLFAEDEAPGESFGRLLMRQGVISNADFVRVIDEMTRASAGNNQLRFGEVAVGLGVLRPEQVERGLGEQVCGIITRSLQRGQSEWTFEPSPMAAEPPRAFLLEINPAVLAALRDPADRSNIADVVAARPEQLVVVAGSRVVSEVRDQGSGATGERHAARMAAEQAFQKGMALLRDTKTASAAIELARAAELQPESLEYLLYATWAKARRYREIPGDSERETLLEIAQRAKRRDPLFAFGSYVIGQLAMWGGDEATAKKWFYEALRLDPASEAGAQVRILARRGARSAAPPGAETSPAASDEAKTEAMATEPAPLAASALPAPAPSRVGTPAAPARPRAGRLAAGAALVVAAVLVIRVAAKSPAPPADLAPAAAGQASPAADAAAPVQPEHPEAPAPPPRKTVDDPQMGTIILPDRAAGHRIFVDGRRAKTEETTDGIGPLHLRCGSHVIQIGSGGTPETIDLPCRGEVHIQ